MFHKPTKQEPPADQRRTVHLVPEPSSSILLIRCLLVSGSAPVLNRGSPCLTEPPASAPTCLTEVKTVSVSPTFCEVSQGSDQPVGMHGELQKSLKSKTPTPLSASYGGKDKDEFRAGQTHLGQHICPFTWQLSSPQIACVSNPKINHERGNEQRLLSLSFSAS